MSKVYLLLRNNKQSGPHSLEELLSMGLKATDLIWIEGKSFGWSYPAEISPLKQYVTPAPDVAQPTQQSIIAGDTAPVNKNENYMPSPAIASSQKDVSSKPRVYVSMPTIAGRTADAPVNKQEAAVAPEATAASIEQKAEELRKKIQSYVPDANTDKKTIAEPLVTKYTSTVSEREEAYTSWIYDSKVGKKNNAIGEIQKNWGSIAIAALLILVIGYGISQYNNDKKDGEVAATTVVPDANKPVPEPLITDEEKPALQPITDVAASDNSNDSKIELGKEEPVTRASQKIEKTEKKSTVQVQQHKNTVASNNGNKKTSSGLPPKDVVITPAQPDIVQVKTAAPVKEATANANTPKKKKSFNEKVDAFFGKFSRKLDQPAAKEPTPQPVNNTANNTGTAGTSSPSGTSERKAVHRDDNKVTTTPEKPDVASTPRVASTNLAEYVQVTSNKPAENWMLGVHGMKVSLHNTGNETVKTAEVELRYYTEQNEILEKKIVNFNNILPGKTVTLPAPDHRLADHADFRLVAAK